MLVAITEIRKSVSLLSDRVNGLLAGFPSLEFNVAEGSVVKHSELVGTRTRHKTSNQQLSVSKDMSYDDREASLQVLRDELKR